MTTPTGRLVWLTDEQRDFLVEVVHMTEWESESTPDMILRLVAAFDAAPADPVEAVYESLVNDFPMFASKVGRFASRRAVADLGVPSEASK